ncbi:acyl-CoA mutase large subunit family protein [Mucilaginibacter phyllosphaerae]|uniref:Methylmalonyl-CoA mutase n=1 Tax=Mucilaginibacter phyllosphaerae TaxID=1812349 RepID=A0A4Y8AAT8_9SPHI|nr:methylmalonyl-CoA mutase family protein [Mucilaginibacter phyllosphaerae]MBB3969570.1 methylmalonyl-CoA mutase N-terminal domain/subunit [Mucilaginibacter phyllosphaerae]TEW64961.1 methylmalonyl-CoA mutase [Mucilaginibacter phyllosphaerae]GGH18840.1 methylmalonyl-CoA mutase [Mucilaginibacter phyllosphaerae]
MAEKKFTTISGIELKEVYTQPSGMNELPGQFPYTRGIQKDMYRGKPWTMRQYAGFSTAEESNKRYHYLLSQGTMGLSVAFDLPTQIGYDSDHELSEGEVGKVGVAIDSLKDIEILFAGIELKDITTSMTINATASILLAMYIALAKKQGADLKQISGTIQNDILKEYAARGTYIYPPGPSMRLITDIFEYCSKEVPKWNTISISGYHIREAGSTAVQELAFTLANGKTYLKAALEKGLDINVFAKRLSFFFNCHNNFFEEIAKFRAARRMWAHITQNLGATDAGAQKLRFHTQTGGSTLTAQQPMNNVVRVSMQALAAVLGGTQSLHTNGYDEALSLPTEAAAKIALRTQQIIAFESGVTDTVDPLAGSYFIEALTDELETAAQIYIDKIDAMGGSVKAIEQDYIQQEIAAAAYQYQNDIESGDQILVGVNKFTQAEEVNPPVFRVDDAIRRQQMDKLIRLKEERDNIQVEKALANLTSAARSKDNLMPYILTAVECYATLGEIADTLRDVFGEY